jgi:hypothetical protein
LTTTSEMREIHRLAMGPVWGGGPAPQAGPAEAPGGFRTKSIVIAAAEQLAGR